MSIEWDGEGIPPVGVECEVYKHSPARERVWVRVKIMYVSEFTVVMREFEDGSSGEKIHHPRTLEFRPAITEAERRRDAAIEAMISQSAVLISPTAGLIYDAIAFGEIPGIRLTDE